MPAIERGVEATWMYCLVSQAYVHIDSISSRRRTKRRALPETRATHVINTTFVLNLGKRGVA